MAIFPPSPLEMALPLQSPQQHGGIFPQPGGILQELMPQQPQSPLQAMQQASPPQVIQAPEFATQPPANPLQNLLGNLFGQGTPQNGFGQNSSRFGNMISDVLIGIGTDLAAGRQGAGAQLVSQRKQRRQAQRKQNQTVEWALKQPQFAPYHDAIRAGVLDPKEVAQMAYGGKKLPASVQEYEYARQNGYEGSYMEFKQSGRPQTNVTVNNKGESKYAEELGKAQAGRFVEFQNEAQTARRALNAFDAMEGMMSQPGFYSGALGDTRLAAKRMATMLGMNPQGVDSMESFNAISKQAALDVMGGSLGTGFSNADRDFVIDQVPNLGNTPEGNQKLIKVQRKLAQRKLQIAELAREYAAQNGGQLDYQFDNFLQQWAEQNPLFTPEDFGPPQTGNLSVGQSTEYDGLSIKRVK